MLVIENGQLQGQVCHRLSLFVKSCHGLSLLVNVSQPPAYNGLIQADVVVLACKHAAAAGPHD